jgi:hypothetical protein
MSVSAEDKHTLSIIVPYRNRRAHLERFVPYIQRYLEGLTFRVLIVEQNDSKPFNRGKLLNVGFSLERERCDYVCFHDIDMLPLEECDYSMPRATTHLAGQVEVYDFKMPYPEYLGGVVLALKDDFLRVDGFSNLYWGYGEEDDDLWLRFQISGIRVLHRPGKFKSLPHPRAVSPLSNLLILEKKLLSAKASARNAETKRLVERRLQSLREELSGEHPATTLIQRRRMIWRNCTQPDGLSTLDYEVIKRRPIRELLSNREVAARHEIFSVRL